MNEPILETDLSSLSPAAAKNIIHSRRKVRYGTACWPCRQRKVKCTGETPCVNCVRRDHAALCSYTPKNVVGTGGGTGRKRARSERSEGSVKPDNESAAESRYLGQNSIAAFLSEEASNVRQDIFPILGLEVSTSPYPFMSIEHMERIRHDIGAALPSNREVLKTFQIYKQIVQPFWGLLIDIEDFESKLCIYLEERHANPKHPATSKGVSSAWLGMLFAVLGVACNYTDQSYHKRAATSQAFVQASFHCLRLANFLVRPSLESLQALLILGFVLANDMKAEASWAMLGTTCRQATSLGLHRGSNENVRIPTLGKDDLARRKLWWTIVWQDSLLSLSFDRAPIAVITRCPIPLGPDALIKGFSYTEAMYHLISKILQSVRNDTNSQAEFNQIIADSNEVEDIRNKVYPHLRNLDTCKSLQDRLQHYALRLHTAFAVSVFCRPALRRGEIGMDISQKLLLASRCKQNLGETVRMYLKMHSLSVIPTRSWAFTYHSLSSAVLLGILGETKTDPEVRELQGNLISALSATAAKEHSSGDRSDKDIELSGPLSRALVALKNIYDHGWIVESKTSNGIGNEAMMAQSQGAFQETAGFEQQDAAIAMASMQNGMVPIDYSQQMLSDSSTLEQTLNMSPMDLFDSIFWESYPSNGLDQLSAFDYSAFPQF